MSITDELRTSGVYSFPSNTRRYTLEELTAIADRIDAEHEAKVSYWQGASYKDGYDEGFASADDWLGQHEDAMAEHGWVRLPKDADGEYIHVGDVMESRTGLNLFPKFEVRAMRYDGDEWELIDRLGDRYEPSGLRHYHAPTVEDVLREFEGRLAEVGTEDMCVGTDADLAREVVRRERAEVYAEYAAKLQLREDA